MNIDTSMTKTIAGTTQRVERDGDQIAIHCFDGFLDIQFCMDAGNEKRIAAINGSLFVRGNPDGEFVFNGSLADLKKMLRKAPTVRDALQDSRLILPQ